MTKHKKINRVHLSTLYTLYFSSKPVAFELLHFMTHTLLDIDESELGKDEFKSNYLKEIDPFIEENSDGTYSLKNIDIRYTDELTLSQENRVKLIQYEKEYEHLVLKKYMDVVWNLDNPKNQELFIKLNPLFLKMFNDEVKMHITHTLQINTHKDETLKIIESMDSNKNRILSKLNIAVQNQDSSLILNYIDEVALLDEDHEKIEILSKLINQIQSIEIINKIINTLYTLNDCINVEIFLRTLPILKAIDSYQLIIMYIIKTCAVFKDQYLLIILSQIENHDIIYAIYESSKHFTQNTQANIISILVLKNIQISKPEFIKELRGREWDNINDRILIMVSLAYSSEGFDKAIETLDFIKDETYKEYALSQLLLKLDDIDEALKYTNSIKDESIRLGVLIHLALTSKNIDKAIEIANQISNTFKKEILLSILSTKSDNNHSIYKLIDSIKTIEQYTMYSSLLVNASKNIQTKDEMQQNIKKFNLKKESIKKEYALLKRVQLEEPIDALKHIAQIKDDYIKKEALTSIISRSDDDTVLKEILETINLSQSTLNLIAQKECSQEIVEKLLSVIDTIDDDSAKASILSNLAKNTQENMSKLNKITIALLSIKSEYHRAEVLYFVLKYARDDEALVKSISTATESFSDNSNLYYAMISGFCNKHIDLYDKEEAISYATKLVTQRKYRAFLDIGVAFKDRDIIDVILLTTRSRDSSMLKDRELALIASKIDDDSEAKKILDEIKSSQERSNAVANLIKKTKKLDEKIELLELMGDLDTKREELILISKKIDDIDKKIELLTSIEIDIDTLYYLIVIAKITEKAEILQKITDKLITCKDRDNILYMIEKVPKIKEYLPLKYKEMMDVFITISYNVLFAER